MMTTVRMVPRKILFDQPDRSETFSATPKMNWAYWEKKAQTKRRNETDIIKRQMHRQQNCFCLKKLYWIVKESVSPNV